MNSHAFGLYLVVVILGGALWWHFTPWSQMALWGELGCASALRETGVLPAGCEPVPVPKCKCGAP